MSNLEQIINISKDLESALETKFGAVGKGLHEKISSVEHILNEELIRKVRFIATIRNKAVHESGYNINDNDMQEVQMCYANVVEGGIESTAPQDSEKYIKLKQKYEALLIKSIENIQNDLDNINKKKKAKIKLANISFLKRWFFYLAYYLGLRYVFSDKYDEIFESIKDSNMQVNYGANTKTQTDIGFDHIKKIETMNSVYRLGIPYGTFGNDPKNFHFSTMQKRRIDFTQNLYSFGTNLPL